MLHTQAADDEIQIFVPGASQRESDDCTTDAAVSDVSLSPTVDATPDTGASDVEVPCDTEQPRDTPSLDVSVTPIAAAAAACDDDIFSEITPTPTAPRDGETSMDEGVSVVNAGGQGEDTTTDVKPMSSPVGNPEAVAMSEEPDANVAKDDQFLPASEGE